MVSGLIRRYSEAGVDRMVSGLIRRYSEAGVDRMVSGLIRRYSEAGVDRMVSGLIRRYSEAGVAPPILLHVDCGCCEEAGGESELKARFGGWPDLVIRLDAWHFLRRLAAGCTTDAHALYPIFMAKLSVCLFEWDPEEVALLRHAKREELRREGVPGISEALVDGRLTKAQLALYCRRRTRGEEAPVHQVEALLQELMGDKGWDLLGGPLLDRGRMEHIWRVQKRHVLHPGPARCASVHKDRHHHHQGGRRPHQVQDRAAAAVAEERSALLGLSGDLVHCVNTCGTNVSGQMLVPSLRLPTEYTGK
ncbi:uncharacterized protein LOC115559188 isoform X2 [Gadus morhua]|uniref:uncharacterized protein LOC115559188 isoform X2 n=1 Tax=Gadus morhua TaxID=8049 RepID=UPI0011B7AAF0|nr:uncharacterized protein LOC115559188 isoform X2 [Gadus morhua]